MIARNEYLQKIISKQNNGMIKIITGIRRCGKSYLLFTIYRNYLLEKHNYKCELCGWGEVNQYTGTIPLEIHHKDGNYKNNSEENLQVLCPNCHSLTETHKSHNKNGRQGRKKYYK